MIIYINMATRSEPFVTPVFAFGRSVAVQAAPPTRQPPGHAYALIVLTAFVVIGVITAVLTALASALPRTTIAIGILYCTAMYGLAAYAITHDPIWTTVIGLLRAVISW